MISIFERQSSDIYYSLFIDLSNSAHLQIKSACSFVGISSGLESLADFGGILPLLTAEQINEAFSVSLAAPYPAHLEKYNLDLGNLPPLSP